MALSRKRERELNRLKRETESLLRDQRDVLEQAARVVRAAGHQASALTREEVAPRVRDAYEDHVRPVARRGRQKFVHDVVPAVSSALGSAVAVIESLRGPANDTLDRVSRSARDIGERTGLVERRSSPAKYIVLGVAVFAVAGVAYAAWQTLRADDSLWIEDEAEFEGQA